MSDVDCDSIISHDCGDDEGSSKRLLGLYIKDKLIQIKV